MCIILPKLIRGCDETLKFKKEMGQITYLRLLFPPPFPSVHIVHPSPPCWLLGKRTWLCDFIIMWSVSPRMAPTSTFIVVSNLITNINTSLMVLIRSIKLSTTYIHAGHYNGQDELILNYKSLLSAKPQYGGKRENYLELVLRWPLYLFLFKYFGAVYITIH